MHEWGIPSAITNLWNSAWLGWSTLSGGVDAILGPAVYSISALRTWIDIKINSNKFQPVI